MNSKMHRLQVSPPAHLLEFVTNQAEKQGVSLAGFVRKLIARELETQANRKNPLIRGSWLKRPRFML